MAMFATNCSICGGKLVPGEHLFSTWGVFFPREHPLWRYCDSFMHWGCYAGWTHRREFADRYFEAWTHWPDENPFWFKVISDNDFFVQACPNPPEQKVEIWLRETGSRIRIPAGQWEAFLSTGHVPEHRLHPLEEAAVRLVIPKLRQSVPRWDDVVIACDSPEARAKLQRMRDEYRKYKEKVRTQNEVNKKVNAALRVACEALLPRLQKLELSCPKCGHRGEEWRYKTAKGPPHFICKSCGCSFGPSDIA